VRVQRHLLLRPRHLLGRRRVHLQRRLHRTLSASTRTNHLCVCGPAPPNLTLSCDFQRAIIASWSRPAAIRCPPPPCSESCSVPALSARMCLR
jgi:hypothetical protein